MNLTILLSTLLSLVTLTLTLALPNNAVSNQARSFNCGRCNSIEGKVTDMVGDVCTNVHPTDTSKRYLGCKNEYCGLCMIFADRDCQGGITAMPERGQGYQNGEKGQSHYCI